MTIKAQLWLMLDNLPSGNYGLWYLTDTLNLITGNRTMPHTVRRYIREYCDIGTSTFTIAVQNKAIYQWTSGVKLSGALIYGKE